MCLVFLTQTISQTFRPYSHHCLSESCTGPAEGTIQRKGKEQYGLQLLKSTFTQGATLCETAIEKNTLRKKSLLFPPFFLMLRNSHNLKSKGRITRYKKILSWAVTLLLKWSCNTIAKGTSATNTDMVGDLSLLDEKKEEKREVGRT